MVASECEVKAIVSLGLQEFLDGPYVVSKPRLHCGRNAESLMYANEVKESHVDGDGGLEMVKALAESQAQPSEAAEMRPHAQIGTFDVRCADTRFIRVSGDNNWNGCCDFRRLIPVWPFSVSRSVQLNELSEINVGSKIFFDGGNVTAETVRRKLKSSDDSFAQVSDEGVGACRFALRDEIGQNQFSVAINRHPNVGIAPLVRRAGTQMPFLCVDKGPQFVGLHKLRANAAHSLVKEVSAIVSDGQKDRKNRALVCASDAGDSANAHAFKQERHDLRSFFSIGVMPSKGSLARLRKRRVAAGAAITLDSLPSVKSESLRFVVLASQAGHGLSLVFLREKPDNQSLGSECGLRPRLDSAPSSVSADGGVFNSSSHIRKFSCSRHHPLVKVVPHVAATEFLNPARFSQTLKCLMNHRGGICVSVYVVSIKQQTVLYIRGGKRSSRVVHHAFNCVSNGHLILNPLLHRFSFFRVMDVRSQRPHESLQAVNLEIPFMQFRHGVSELLSRIFQSGFQISASHCSLPTTRSLFQ
jgi:hypothetical protein